jgi:hypothetical protein
VTRTITAITVGVAALVVLMVTGLGTVGMLVTIPAAAAGLTLKVLR